MKVVRDDEGEDNEESDLDEGRMPFLDHLRELRVRSATRRSTS